MFEMLFGIVSDLNCIPFAAIASFHALCKHVSGSMFRFKGVMYDLIFGLNSSDVSSCLIFINVVMYVGSVMRYVRMVYCVKRLPNRTFQVQGYRYSGQCTDTLKPFWP